MKKVLAFFVATIFIVDCNDEKKEAPEADKTAAQTAEATSSVTLPYTASYSSQFNDKVSDEELLLILNSYKYWQDSDINALTGTLADSVSFHGADGTIYSGAKSGLVDMWKTRRATISSVKIEMDAWTKNHSTDKNEDFVNVWYKETDTYKNGKVDSAYYEDINQLKDGKIAYYAQYRQEAVKK